MTNTIVASSHSVTMASRSLRAMKRAIGYVTNRARGCERERPDRRRLPHGRC